MSLKSVCRMNTQRERAGKVARVKEMAPFYPKVRPGIGHALSRTDVFGEGGKSKWRRLPRDDGRDREAAVGGACWDGGGNTQEHVM